MQTLKLSIKKAFIKLVCSALLIVGSSSVYAACIVDGISYNVGGTGLSSSSGAGGAITRTIIKDDWDTTDDDVSTCDVSAITDMSELFRDNASFNDVIGTWDVSNVTTMTMMFRDAIAFNQDISSWNVSSVINMTEMFRDEVVDSSNRQQFNQDISPWNVSSVTDMSYMFNGASVFNNGNAALDWGHTSSVTNMENMFRGASTFNQDISDLNVANVTNMREMFRGANAFNQDISDLNVANVTNMREMFNGASAFNNGGVALDWNVSKVTTMLQMFDNADAFNQDVSGWNVIKVTSMKRMFANTAIFNNGGVALTWGDKTSKVTTMFKMFYLANAFNQDVSDWNVAAVTSMKQMFRDADDFNNGGVALDWSDTSKVTDMYEMFSGATVFNQDVSTSGNSWNVAEVITMYRMFKDADAFNQDISSWDVSKVRAMNEMFYGATQSTANYDALLIAWDALELYDGVNFYAGSSKYTASSVASAARANMELSGGDNWTITDGGSVADSTVPTLSSSTPADGASGIAVDANIELNFSEIIYVKTGNITIKNSSDDSTVETIDVAGGLVTGTGTTTITINPSSTLIGITNYYLNIADSAFDDTASNSYAGITNATTLNFTTASDSTAPTLSSSTPADDATEVAVDANIVLIFSEAVDVESGNIVIKKTSDGSAVETISLPSGLVTGTGTTTITINPSTTLASSTGYYLNIADSAFDDTSSNSYAGINNATSLNFTTGDATIPTLSSSTPADDATEVAVDANIVLIFSEAVDVESGNITIKKTSDNSTIETFNVASSGLVTGTGTTTITINPSSTLIGITNYYLNIAATAFDDSSGNSYAGITDATTLNFTTIVTNLPSPLDKKDVIGSIEAWSDISSRWAESSSDNALGRIDWLNRHKGSTKTSHQGIKLNFVDTLINKIMNNSPGTALSDIDVVNTSATIINNSDGTLAEVIDNVEQKATDIAINEAVRLREGLIGSLNPSFGPVTGNWSVWTEGKVVIGKTDASTTASKKEIEIQAFALGIDRPVGSGDELMGFVLNVGQDDTDIGTAKTNVKSNNYSLSNYNVFKTSSGVQLESVFGLGHLDFDTTRTDGSDTLTGTRKAHQLFFSSVFRPQKNIHFGSWQLSPYSKVSVANTRLNSFSESGALTALTFDKQELRDAAVGVGFDINTQITTGSNTIKPFAKLEYARSSSKTSASMHYNIEDASTYTYTTSLNTNTKNWKMKLGLDFNTKSGWDMSVSYTREQSIGSSANKKNSNSFRFNAATSF